MHVCCIYVNIACQPYDEFYNKAIFTHIQIPLGLSYIISSLKYEGYTTDLLIYNNVTRNDNFISNIKINPDVFAISIISPMEYNIVKEDLLPLLKKHFKNSKILVGGTAITLLSDHLCENIKENMKHIDAFCFGEGEKAVVTYVKQLEQNKFTKTDNLLIKNDNVFLKCDNIYNIENIDALPSPEIDSWSKYCVKTKELRLQLSISRGCANQCIYCANQIFRNKTKGKYYRIRSPESIIKEIDYLYNKYKNLNFIYLQAESGVLNLPYFIDLCKVLKEYGNKIGNKIKFAIAFNFMPTFNNVSVDLVKLIKQANFELLVFSIETGSLEIRKKLNRPYYSNEQLIIFCKNLREYDIKSKISIMYCYPFETKQTYYETVNLLKNCKPTSLVVSFLRPEYGTKLYDFYQEHNIKKPSIFELFKWITLKWRVYFSYKSLREILLLMFEGYKSSFIVFRLKSLIDLYINNKNKNKIMLAKQYFNEQKYKESIKYFNKIDVNEDNYWIYGDRAIAKMNIGNYKEAIEDFDKILKLDPNKDIYKQKKQECINLLNKQED